MKTPQRFLSLVLVAMTLLVSIQPPGVRALNTCDTDAIFRDSVNYVSDDCSDGTSFGNCSTALAGADNREKVWNFFISKGLKPIAVAGILGNYSREDYTADPALKQNYSRAAIPDGGDGVTGYGIEQWTSKDRQAALFTKIRAAGLQQYYGAGWGSPEVDKSMPTQDNDALLTIELNFAWNGDTRKIQDFATQLNAATSVDGSNGSATLFEVAFEGGTDLAFRIQAAKDALQKYGGGSSGATTNGAVGCGGQLGGVSKLDDAIPWAMKFVSDTAAKYKPGGHTLGQQKGSEDGGIVIRLYNTNDGYVGGGSCWGATYCGQCTALSGWFVTNETGYTFGNGNGGEVVGNLAAKGVPTGKDPKPFSIFSYPTGGAGHTGVVLGVLANGDVITVENNWFNNDLAIKQYNIKQVHPAVTFAYVGDKLKVPGISPGN